jgi:hypothetical protein
VTSAEDVEAAFARYLEAAAWLRDVSDVASGPAARGRNPEFSVEEGRFELRRCELVRIEDGAADVLLVAKTATRGRHRTIGEMAFELRFDGPATARRTGGRWFVTDVTENGRRRSVSVRELSGTVVARPARIEGRSLNLGGIDTRLALDVTNDGDEPLLLTDALAGTRIWRLPWRYRHAAITRGRECDPGETAETLLSWGKVALSTRELRLVLKVAGQRTGAAHAAHLAILPRDGAVTPLAGVPIQVRSPTVASSIRLLPFVPPVVLLAAQQLVAAAVVSLVEVTVFVVVVVRWRLQRRTTTPQLLVGLLLASLWAIGALVLLAWSE